VSIPICRDCGAALGHRDEKALSGEVQMVWADLLTDEWVCPKTGNEHVQVMGGPLPEPGAFIVIEGNPIDGFVAHGIPAFADYEAAVEWAAETCQAEWWVMPLQDVE
jgi:hypothetical protein